MHIIGIMVFVISVIAVWYWRLKLLREAGSEVMDAAGKLRGSMRRRSLRNKAAAAPINTISEPGLAAVTFYLAVAMDKPRYLEEAKDIIRNRMRGIIPATDMDEYLSYGEWAIKNVTAPNDLVRKFRNLWLDNLNKSERLQLVEIAEAVCDVGGPRLSLQDVSLEYLRREILQ